MLPMKNKSILKVSIIALFAAIICVGCFIKIPLGPVPIVLQNAICILTGVLLGGFSSSLPTALFLAAGLIGLPVYSGGTGGIAIWVGPTGGFLPGYFLGALTAGLIAGKPSVSEKKISFKTILRLSLAILAGLIILYIPGIFHFAHWAEKAGKVPENKTAFLFTLTTCVLPFIPGDLIKAVLILPVALKIRPVVAQYLYSEVKSNEIKNEPENDSNS